MPLNECPYWVELTHFKCLEGEFSFTRLFASSPSTTENQDFALDTVMWG